ncbi:MAG: hypothetical protein U5O39_05525 [Gammaproteobacteria bacterium]|nr:hypothetical protein [Gammaproteobacteria bacterium]
MRYNLSASYYSYAFNIGVFLNWGAVEHNLTLPDGSPVDPLRTIAVSQNVTNVGASFGLMYDLTDSTTVSFEGRVQNDENCAEDDALGSLCQEADSFAPRVGITHASQPEPQRLRPNFPGY